MIYSFMCDGCGHVFDRVKPVSEHNTPEACTCGQIARRLFSSRIELRNTRVQEAEYNPGLGCITHSRQHRAEIAKQKGLVEIGNEPVENIHTHFEKQRQENWERGWDKIDSQWIGNGE